jgi:hypothetical protein
MEEKPILFILPINQYTIIENTPEPAHCHHVSLVTMARGDYGEGGKIQLSPGCDHGTMVTMDRFRCICKKYQQTKSKFSSKTSNNEDFKICIASSHNFPTGFFLLTNIQRQFIRLNQSSKSSSIKEEMRETKNLFN